MVSIVFFISAFCFLLGYLLYGKLFLQKKFSIDDSNPTPAHTLADGIDYVPAQAPILLGHHFSSIAGAGPIVGPIIASLAFGWFPALLWIVLGSIFVGGVHDYTAVVASIRHKGRSIAEMARENMSPLSYRLLLSFIWLALVYILIVFMDLTASTFVENGGVATSSILYIALALGFGFSLYRLKMFLPYTTIVFVSLVFIGIWVGQIFPIEPSYLEWICGDPERTWSTILLLYCFFASTAPVWILLQPRDYLSSYLLYASVLMGIIGIAIGGFPATYPAILTFKAENLGYLFPMLFITVACGACSGFHSVVASGTTSKQLNKESDALKIGYGGMLLEGVVAVIALATVMMLVKSDFLSGAAPLQIYGAGMGRFFSAIGLPSDLGKSFGLLALSTFILTTLDTATRLGRYIFEEFFNIRGTTSRYLSTLATILLPALSVLVELHDPKTNLPIPAWKAIWPVFGATNQLLAGLGLLVISVWLIKSGKKAFFTLCPMVFMLIMTITALTSLIYKYGFTIIGVIAAILLALALLMVMEAVRLFFNSRKILNKGDRGISSPL